MVKTQKLETYDNRKMCKAMCKVANAATKTFKELREAFALLVKKQEEDKK